MECRKNTILNTIGMDLPFYLAFQTSIYLFKINNKIKRILCQIYRMWRRKAPYQMCETKLLRMCSFSIISTYLHSLNFSFPLLFMSFLPLHLSSTLIPCIATLAPTLFTLPARFLSFSHWFPETEFPSPYLYFYPYSPHSFPQFIILTFTDSLISL